MPSGTGIRALYDPAVRSSLFKDAEMTQPVMEDGDPVGAMRDLSGHGRHLLQTVASSRPTYRHETGRHWLEGNGTSETLVGAFSLTSYPMAIVAGFEMLSDDDEGGIVAVHENSGSYKTLMQSSAGSYQLRATDRASFVLDARTSVTGAPHVAVASFEASAMTLSVDGVLKGTTANTNSIGSAVDIRLFSFRDTDRWYGRIYAAAIVVGAVPADVRNWLNSRAGVTT